MTENKVEVRLFAYLRDNRGKRLYMNVNSIRQVLDELQISDEDAYLVLINGKDAQSKEDLLNDGDILSIFPQVGGG